jgi:hypothetical protein
VQAAGATLAEMATFAEAGVSNRDGAGDDAAAADPASEIP